MKSGRGKALRGDARKTKNARELSDYAQVPVDEQQQARIVAYFAGGQKMETVPEVRVEVSETERSRVIAELKSGKITSNEVAKFLRQVTMPLDDMETNVTSVFRRVSESPKQKQILAVATGHDVRNWQSVSGDDLENLLGKPLQGQIDYRTPVGFAEFRESFLAGIEAQATKEQMAEYNQAMDALEEKIYGPRFDYYRQVRLMMDGETLAQSTRGAAGLGAGETVQKASAEGAGQTVGGVTSEGLDGVADGAATSETVSSAVAAKKVALANQAVKAVTAEQSAQILAATIIMGDAWRQDGNDYKVNATSLTNGGLVPAYELSVSGMTMACSVPFQLSDGRGAILGYVAVADGWRLRSFYLNQRTGLWHYAPDIIRGPRGEGMAQITEGYGLVSTMLPAVLQQAMTELVKKDGFREVTAVNVDFLFAGSCAAYDSLQEWREALARGAMRNDYYQEVDARPAAVNWQSSGKNKSVPQLLSVSAEMAPNFGAKLAGFQTYSILAGQVRVEAFASNDGRVNWVFCSDDWRRTWIGNIEVVSEMTSTGCYKAWLQAGDMVTPLYEYSAQTGGYGDTTDVRKGVVGMWNLYLSRIPLIQQYLASNR